MKKILPGAVASLAASYGDSVESFRHRLPGYEDIDTWKNAVYVRSVRGAEDVIDAIKGQFPEVHATWPEPVQVHSKSKWVYTVRKVEGHPMVEVPVAGTAAAGMETFTDADLEPIIIPQHMLVPDAMAWIAEGDSMMPAIRPGDYIIAEPAFRVKVHHAMLVSTEDGIRVKVIEFDGKDFILVSTNPKYPPEKLQTEAQVIGLVTGIFRYQGLDTDTKNRPRGVHISELV